MRTEGNIEIVFAHNICIGGGILQDSKIGKSYKMIFNTIISDNSTDEEIKQMKDDAEYICKAVNSHEKLVEILKELLNKATPAGKSEIGKGFYKGTRMFIGIFEVYGHDLDEAENLLKELGE